MHFESSILVSIILRTTLAACTLVLPVIIRTSVSEGGKCRGGSREEQTTSGNTCNDPVFDIGSGAFRCTSPSPVAFNLFHLHVPKQKIGSYGAMGSPRLSPFVNPCRSFVVRANGLLLLPPQKKYCETSRDKFLERLKFEYS